MTDCLVGQRIETSMTKVVPKQYLDLSEREKKCLEFLAAGYRQKEIADQLGVQLRTIEQQICSARKKLGARTTIQTVAIAISEKYIAF